MTVTVTVLAKIDGDGLIRAMQMPGLEAAEIGLVFEVKYKGTTAQTESKEDVLTFLKLLAQPEPPKLAPALPDPTPAERP